jgi:hypothetical protein
VGLTGGLVGLLAKILKGKSLDLPTHSSYRIGALQAILALQKALGLSALAHRSTQVIASEDFHKSLPDLQP